MAQMTAKQFNKYLDRDGGCWHCGDTETAIPHHRANRGMGGSKRREVPSNVIVMCSIFNGLMESDTSSALAAMQFGWKIPGYASPINEPVYNMNDGCWYVLNNEYEKELVSERRGDGGSTTPL